MGVPGEDTGVLQVRPPSEECSCTREPERAIGPSARRTAAPPGRRCSRSPGSASSRQCGRAADDPLPTPRSTRPATFRRLGGLPLRAGLLGQRHRVQHARREGVSWSPDRPHPDRPVGSGVDHFIPGLAVDPATSGAGAHLALTYYFYPGAACTRGHLSSSTSGYVFARRRRDVERADDARRADVAAGLAATSQAWSATTSRRP